MIDRPDAFRPDPTERVRRARALARDIDIAFVRPWRTIRRILGAALPTRGDRIFASVLVVIALVVGGWAIPQLAGIPLRAEHAAAFDRTR